MSNFLEQLKEQQARTQQQGNFNDEKVDSPYKHLQHPPLNFNAKNTSFTVRILPPLDDDVFFSREIREVWFETVNKNGKTLNSRFTVLGEDTPDSSIVVNNFVRWQNENRIPARKPERTKLTKRYLVNAVQVGKGPDGKLYPETDANGNIMVRLLTLPQSAFAAIVRKLSDEMLVPNGADERSFLSEANAFPIRISKPDVGAMTYNVDVYTNYDLGPLPSNWKELCEDLEYQATPTEKYNANFVEYFIKVVNGEEDNTAGSDTQSNQGSFGGGQQPTQHQNFNQNQSQQNFNQNQSQQNTQPPQQNNQGSFGGQQSQQNAQPPQNNTGQGNFGGQQPPQQSSQGNFGGQQTQQNTQPPQQNNQQNNQGNFTGGFGNPEGNYTNQQIEDNLPTDLSGVTPPNSSQGSQQQPVGNGGDVAPQNIDDVLAGLQQNLEG